MKILMVCLGNICRSPLAHGLLQKKVEERNLDWTIDSAGTGSYHIGELPDQRSIDIAKQNNLDITYQRARQFKRSDFKEFDLIFAMDSSNYNDILSMAETEAEKEKVYLILNESQPGENRAVPDPYYGGDEGFKNVYNMLNKATDSLIKRLTN